jgi:hypothetical protein
VSHAGWCEACGIRALNENQTALTTKSGPAYERWQMGMAAYHLSVANAITDAITQSADHAD